MPLDILYEVFLHLYPYDLLQLARTTKTLRKLLMTRSALTIWKRASENLADFPDCPGGLTEPAYVNLMFSPHCHFCIKARVLKVMWACRVRCCKSCFKDAFVDFDGLSSIEHPRYDALRPAAMLPSEVVNDKVYFLKRDVHRLFEYLATFNGDAQAFKDVEDERIQAVEDQEQIAEALEDWRVADNHRRRTERTELTKRREDQILERLRQCGFRDDLRYMTSDLFLRFMNHPLVKQPKELTDRIWNNIKAPMMAWVEEARGELRMHQHCEHYTDRLCVFRSALKGFYALHHYPEVVPSVADFSWHTPAFREILDKGRDEFFGDLEHYSEEFNEVIENVMERWRADMARQLYDMVPPEIRPPLHKRHTRKREGKEKATDLEANEDASDAGEDDAIPTDEQITLALNAPVTWFRCTVNGCLLDYPRVLAHECAKTGPPVNLQPETERDDLQNAYHIVLKEFPWNFTGDKIVYDMDAHRAAEEVVRATLSNMNAVPHLTDKSWFDNLDERYVCGQCSNYVCLCVMPWRVAVKHISDETHRGKDVRVTMLNVADRLEVLDQEAESSDFLEDQYKMWGCIREDCRTPAMTLIDLTEHIIVRHDVELPVHGVDYALHPDAITTPDVPAYDMIYPGELFTTPIQH
ncbi:hypothetical protein K466DRAFT_595360 [Polyporus arcularius HHB13444]|uniref:F-box domain-containing protein n=1 Tax=Polyporus arcularius HHB13444 TaxID=1314778 RepID=A0A5C3PRC9_9APHY|nr:hypothetical protein K466DRAFT_595360 [Polyporus arcularius HHB13444]